MDCLQMLLQDTNEKPCGAPRCRELPGELEKIRVWFRDYKVSIPWRSKHDLCHVAHMQKRRHVLFKLTSTLIPRCLKLISHDAE